MNSLVDVDIVENPTMTGSYQNAVCVHNVCNPKHMNGHSQEGAFQPVLPANCQDIPVDVVAPCLSQVNVRLYRCWESICL